MANPLPRLRRDLDLMPSPIADRPGLLLRDSFRYSDAILVLPPPLVPALELFDGRSDELDLRALLTRLTGDLATSGLAQHLIQALDEAAFLENTTYERYKQAKHAEFAGQAVREPAHAGGAYPDEPAALSATFERYFAGTQRGSRDVCAIAAPHVSPEGGWESYRDAYSALPAHLGSRTFIVLGTSHYGAPERFGLTRKPFRTPLGDSTPALDLIEALHRAAPDSIQPEDYCHAVEHSIEFQVLFLQRLFGPDVRVAPILCGSFARSIYGQDRRPEDHEPVRRFFGALREAAPADAVWVLGVDMAHLGRRYGDPFAARAQQDHLAAAAARDQQRIASLNAFDADTYWEQVQERQDDLRWCGSAPFYTYLRTAPKARGELLRYQQWNIDESSVVSFAGMRFTQENKP
ncbi:MAG: AmmeMemoRadiSam system protein B [Bryobacteraceae bacterium]|nr:AmmeMemoRadiSam system protein B [Bryobacteraceae bacterium]